MRTIRKAGIFQEPRKAFCKYLKPGRFFMFLGWSDALFEKGLRPGPLRRISESLCWSDALF